MRRFPGFGALALIGLVVVEVISLVTVAAAAMTARLEVGDRDNDDAAASGGAPHEPKSEQTERAVEQRRASR